MDKKLLLSNLGLIELIPLLYSFCNNINNLEKRVLKKTPIMGHLLR